MTDAFEAVMIAIAVVLGLGHLALAAGAVGHYLVGAARRPATSLGWAERVDPDHLIPPTTDRVAPVRERAPGVTRG